MDWRKTCMFCGVPLTPPTEIRGAWKIPCPRCSEYFVTEELLEDGPTAKRDRYLVSSWLRWRALRAEDAVALADTSVIEIINDAPRYRPVEKMECLLTAIAITCKKPGGLYHLANDHSIPFAWAETEEEVNEYFAWLDKGGLVVPRPGGRTLTQDGWERYEDLTRKGNATSMQGFVAMWFDESMDGVWNDGIAPGIRDAGFEPYRVKGEVHGERIDAHIVAAIKAARFVVADVTGSRPAVYYEAGLADGIGKPVFWTCQKKEEKSLCFDTRQFPHILWESPAQLRDELAARINAKVV